MPRVALSQYGEDIEILRLLNSERGFYVEIGAHDGLLYSNTYLFEKLGWTGILVEADPMTAEACRTNRPGSMVKNVALSSSDKSGKVATFYRVPGCTEYSGFEIPPRSLALLAALGRSTEIEEVPVTCLTADELLRECGVQPDTIQFCTIDVEGTEFSILQGFTLAYWRPGLVLVENNKGFPDLKILKEMRRNGYFWLRATGVNDWFVRHTVPGWPGYLKELLCWARYFLFESPRRVGAIYFHLLVLRLKGLL